VSEAPIPDPPQRGDVLAMLASYGGRRPDQVPEHIDSMELAWLVHQVEQRYGFSLDSDDEALARMTTVSGAVRVLGELRELREPGREAGR
jgi:hypothetical protein